jgi:Xaa-Pro aminopeptidase
VSSPQSRARRILGRMQIDPRPFAARRERLARQLGARPALIAAGSARARNYADNTFPFRAASHFLYLFGRAVAGGLGLWDGASWTLFARPPTADDALWHGPEPTLDDLGAALGCPARPLDGLAAVLAALPAVATLPTPDLETCAEQQTLLARPIRPGHLDAVDEPLADAMIALRLVHDDAAVAELRAAAVATAAAHRAGMKATRPGGVEAEVRAAMEAELAARGMTVSYNSIVTVHGEVLHNNHYHHRLGPNDLLLADVGAETPGGWAGDVTRTWPVSGHFSATQRDMYEVVLRAQEATIAAVKPGVRYRDLHLLAARLMTEGLVALGILAGDPQELVADGVTALLFPHGVGHLLGLDVHDMEDLGDRAGYAPGRQRATEFGLRYLRLDRDLVAGMAVTIEPGLYVVPAILDDANLARRAQGRLRRDRLAAFSDVRGIRIEDDVLVTPTGSEVLSATIPKAPAAVEAAMQ